MYLAHFSIGEHSQIIPTGDETDRSRFLGRGGNTRAPSALLNGPLTDTTGATLDPVMALQAEIDVQPYDTQQVAFVTVAAGSRKDVL